jgi:hypothetical protein
MRALLFSAVAIGAMTGTALAHPVSLSESQMDRVTAGDIRVTAIGTGHGEGVLYARGQVDSLTGATVNDGPRATVQWGVASVTAVGVGSSGQNADAQADATVDNPTFVLNIPVIPSNTKAGPALS